MVSRCGPITAADGGDRGLRSRGTGCAGVLIRCLIALAVLAGVAATPGGRAIADARGFARVTGARGQQILLYQESHALVVGASAYRAGWPALPGVRDDIPAVEAALARHGFAVEVVRDPDGDRLRRVFREFIVRHGQGADHRLLVYFAGHGYTQRLAYGGEMGYLVPVDAPDPNRDLIGFLGSALSMQMIEVFAREIQAKHALFVFDSCFSGSIFEVTRGIPATIQEKTGRPVRQFITSGTADQEVPDRSIFREQFVEALTGSIDAARDGYLTGAELGQFLEQSVTNYTRRAQTPQYGKLRDPHLDKGDFVFVLPDRTRPTAGSPPPPPPGSLPRIDPDAMACAALQTARSATAFEAYLAEFPNGLCAGFARVRLAALAPPPAPPAAAPAPPPAPRRPAPPPARDDGDPRFWLGDVDRGCRVRNPQPEPGETVTWSGGCRDGYGAGPGLGVWFNRDGREIQRVEMTLVRGRRHGEVTFAFPSGTRAYARYHNGERQSIRRVRNAGGPPLRPAGFGASTPGYNWTRETSRGCLIWNPKPQPQETVTWSGRCRDGTAHGPGVARWTKAGRPSQVDTVTLVDGKRHGRARIHFPRSGRTYVGTYDHGRRVSWQRQ